MARLQGQRGGRGVMLVIILVILLLLAAGYFFWLAPEYNLWPEALLRSGGLVRA